MMQSKSSDINNFDEILQLFLKWIKYKTSSELRAFSQNSFMKDMNLASSKKDVVKDLFAHLVQEEKAKVNIEVYCPDCNETIMFTSGEEKTKQCNRCGYNLIYEDCSLEKDAKKITYFVSKEKFFPAEPAGELDIVRKAFMPEHSAKKINNERKSGMNDKKDRKSFDLAIITALQSEMIPVRNLLKKKMSESTNSIEYCFGEFRKDEEEPISVVTATLDQMGLVPTAFLIHELLTLYDPKYIVMTGICAGVDSTKHGYGDILIADEIWDYGSGKIVEEGEELILEPSSSHYRLNANLKRKIRSFKNNLESELYSLKKTFETTGTTPKTELKIHIGPMSSGSQVVASERRIQKIQLQNRKVIGIEMEIYSLFYVCHQLGKESGCFSMKSIVDFANNDKSDDYQKYGAFTSANVLYEFCFNGLFE